MTRSGPESLCDPARLAALADSGLSAAPDPEMELVAARVRRWLDVPVALVSLVQADRQVFPGMVGLPEPWASLRATPLTHSFCQHVVTSGEPLVIENAPEHQLVRDNLAIADLGVMAYAGMPLTDADGQVLGSLCAIDTRPRAWTPTELDALHDLAQGCSVELRLRLSRHDAEQERTRHDRLEATLRESFEQSQTLLSASQRFTAAATIADVRDRIGELASAQLPPSYVGISLLGIDGLLHRNDGYTSVAASPTATHTPAGDGGPPPVYEAADPFPSATAVRLGRIVHYGDRAVFDADHPPESRQLLRDLGLHAVVAVPLSGDNGVVGAMILGWDRPRRIDPVELLTLTTIAGFAAQALHRAELLQHRMSVAQQMQQALLTTLPDVPGVALAARYRPADSREYIGGDWYDAIPAPGTDPGRTVLAVTVGDIVGHNLQAAMVMGRVRSMLRQASWDHPGAPPSSIVTALETAGAGLGSRAVGSAILAHLDAVPGEGWSMTWTNAGHPPPVLLTPGSPACLLDEHDHLFGIVALRLAPRHDHHRHLAPGATLFFYSDGLIERRHHDLDTGLDRLLDLLTTHRQLSCQALVDLAVDTLGADSPDDVIAFAVRVGHSAACDADPVAGPTGAGDIARTSAVTVDVPPRPE